MKRIIKIFLILILTLTGLSTRLNAQLPPIIDKNWQLDTNLSDDFNTLDKTKWYVLDERKEWCNWGNQSRFDSNNVSVSNGILHLRTDAPTGIPPYSYTNYECCYTGGIKSLVENYQNGYFEIYTKLPGNYHDGNPNGQKFWPAFWTYHQECIGSYTVVHDEIDILEPNGFQYAQANKNVFGWHDENGQGGSYKVKGGDSFTSPSPLFLDYHKYAVEWYSDRIIFYFDDIPIYIGYKLYTGYNQPSLIMDHQFVVIDLQIHENVNDFNPSITFPQFMEVDYFKYYQLRKDCETDAIILAYDDLSSFLTTPAIKHNITIGNGLSMISLNEGDRITFRATNETIIYGDFTVPIGSELNIIPTPCN
jgi:beta-glucanase (GH16 family)